MVTEFTDLETLWGNLIFRNNSELLNHYQGIGYNLDVMRQTACEVVNPITVYSYAFLFNARRRLGPQTQ